ncbi:MAG: tyrosine-type recombinase/integrase [Candidatus Thermoplasmatota archaeon]|nr:tyrosine-type recombinase/integrase [Candidatus Thermoplasmatota archaeon]
MMYYEDKRLSSTKRNLLEDKKVSKNNKDLIFKFADELTAAGITIGRVQKYCYYLSRIAKILNKDFSKATKDDIVNVLNAIEKATVTGGATIGKPLSDWGKHDYRVVLKRFYKWLRTMEYEQQHKGKRLARREYPEEVDWFAISFPRSKRRKPRNLLDIDDIEKMVNAANNTRNKLFVRMLYETGARIGEMLSLTLDGVEFDEHGATVQIFGKTGERKLRVIDSVPLLAAWRNREHPHRNDKKSLLFCGLSGNDVGYDYYRIMLHRLAKKVGIKKPSNPHHFRHSRATELAKYLTEAQLCYYMGWVPGSPQPGTYVHLSGRDLDAAVLRMKGIEIEKQRVEKKQPITCPNCHTVNDSLSHFCLQCGMALDLKTIMDFDKKKEQDVATVALLEKKLGKDALEKLIREQVLKVLRESDSQA